MGWQKSKGRRRYKLFAPTALKQFAVAERLFQPCLSAVAANVQSTERPLRWPGPLPSTMTAAR